MRKYKRRMTLTVPVIETPPGLDADSERCILVYAQATPGRDLKCTAITDTGKFINITLGANVWNEAKNNPVYFIEVEKTGSPISDFFKGIS